MRDAIIWLRVEVAALLWRSRSPWLHRLADRLYGGPYVTDVDGSWFENERRCRECGCTDCAACVDINGPCWWVEDDLCSSCAESA